MLLLFCLFVFIEVNASTMCSAGLLVKVDTTSYIAIWECNALQILRLLFNASNRRMAAEVDFCQLMISAVL